MSVREIQHVILGTPIAMLHVTSQLHLPSVKYTRVDPHCWCDSLFNSLRIDSSG